MAAPVASEHPVRIRNGHVRGVPVGGALGSPHDLQYVPMLDGLSISVHPEDVDAGDPGVLRIVVKQIEEIHMRPDVVADGDNLVDLDPGSRALLDNLTKELSKGVGAVPDERIMLDVSRCHEPC